LKVIPITYQSYTYNNFTNNFYITFKVIRITSIFSSVEQGDDVDAIKRQLKTQIKLKKGETIRKGAGRNKGKLMIAYKGGRYKNSQGYNSDSSSESDSSSSEDDLAAFCKKLQLEPPRAKQTRKKARESSSESESEAESETD